jgi:hypothetical protein
MTVLALMAACALLCGDTPHAQDPTPAESDVPVSIPRIQQRLQRPSVLRMPREPDFRVTVEEDSRLRQTALDMLRQELAGEAISLPRPFSTAGQQIVGVDLLYIARSIAKQISATRRARGERNARRQVTEALAEFCASHDCAVLEHELNAPKPEGILTH